MVSYSHALKTTSHFLFYQVPSGELCIEVFNPFELDFVHGDRYGSTFILLRVDIQVYPNIFGDAFFFSLYNFSFQKKSGAHMCGH